MKKYIFIYLSFFFMIFLIGCNQNATTTYQITLVQDNKADVIIEVFDREEVILPMAEKENHFFLGWSDGEKRIYNEYIANKNITLTAEFEHIGDAFTNITYNETSQEVIFYDFIGESKHVVLPHSYNGYFLNIIAGRTFKDSDIESIHIPNSVYYVLEGAFENASELKEVIFYGDMAGYKSHFMPANEVETILEEFGCNLNFESEPTEKNPWIFPEGCPITKIIHRTDSVYHPDMGELFTYRVVQDLSVYSTGVQQVFYTHNIFKGADKLEKIHLPIQLNFFNPEIFKTNHQLKYISIDETNQKYKSINNILYSNEDTLIFYPGGLKASEYYLPEHITKIGNYAFVNHHIKTLYLHENLKRFHSSAFYNLESLENVYVDDNHKILKSKDGIIYNKSDTILFYYPTGKKATSFSVPSTVEFIAEFAFANQKYLESVEFNHGLIQIASYAFFNVHKIDTINLPETVSYIDQNAFYTNNGQINTVFIRNKDKVISISSNILKTHENLKIYIPEETYNDYFDYPYMTFWGIYSEYFTSYTID